MNKGLLEKTYPGEIPRPSVDVTLWENENFIMAATSWGNKDVHKEISDSYTEYLTASMADREATSPFAKILTLSPLANSLRAATLFANEKACRKCNNDFYSSGCEALVIAFENNEMAWIQVGQPHFFLIRQNRLVPLEVALDLSVDYEVPNPLPGRLIGIDPQIDVTVKSLLIQPEDRLFMLARSTIPPELFTQEITENNQDVLKKFFNATVTADEKAPFWMGLFG